MSKSTKNKRKWFWRPKISLRTILLAMVFCALFCSWVQLAETQRTIFNQIKMDERECERKHTRPRFSCRLQTAPAWLQWLPESVRTFRGGHYFRNVTELNISESRKNPEDEPDAWRRIAPLLGGCKKISFFKNTLKDFHFSALRKARNLEYLELSHVSIDPESEESFPPFVHLEELSIDGWFYVKIGTDYWNEDWNEDLIINDDTGATARAAVLAARFVELSKSKKLRSVSVDFHFSGGYAGDFVHKDHRDNVRTEHTGLIGDGNVNGPAHLMIDQLANLKNLERVHLNSRLITDEAVEALSGSPLEYLTLDSPLITDGAVEALSDLPSLKKLALDSPLITDEAVEALSGLPSLEELTLASPLITDEAVEALSDLPLKELTLASPLSDVAAESIAKIKALEVLQLRNTQITDAGVRHFSTLPNLRKLDLRDSLVSRAARLSLASAKNLKKIDLHEGFYSDYRDYYERDLKKLRTVAGDPTLAPSWLDFSKSDIGDEELAVLKHFPELIELDLSDTNVTDAGLNVLKYFPELTELDLSYTNVTDAGLKSLLLSMADGSVDATTDLSEIPPVKLWPNLLELKLSGTKVGPLWVKFASQQPNLKKCLFADNSKIDDGCFTGLEEGAFSKLRSLDLSGTSVGNNVIQTILSFPELRRLNLSSTTVGDGAIPFLLKSKLTTLRTFDCRFTRRGIQTLTPVIYEVCTQEKGKNTLSEFGITQPAGAPWPDGSRTGRSRTSKAIAELLKVKQPEIVAIERTSGLVVPRALANIYRGDWFFVIDSPKLTLEHLRPVQVQKEIQGLSLRQCDLSVDDLAELRSGYVPDLELTQRFCEVPWLESFSKSGLVKVGRLRLHRKDLGMDHLKAIQTLQSLDDLSLSGGNWKTEDMQWLAVADGFSELKHLDFADADISYDVLMGLKNHPALIEIKARNCHWRKDDCDLFLRGTVEAQGPYDFKSNQVDLKEVFAALPDDARTYELSFNATNCSDEDWEALTRLKCLCTLTVFGGKLDSTSMDCLARLPFLQSLHLVNVEIDDRALAEFRQLSKLKTLSFTEMELGKLDWRNAISRCKLSKVVIDHCGLATRPRDFAPILCPETGHRIRVFKHFLGQTYVEPK